MIAEALNTYLATSAALHSHLCPRQILGVRVALAGTKILQLDPNIAQGRLLVILEMDGCFADAVQVVTKASLGKHRLRFEDYGRVAATFVDLHNGDAVRVAAHPEARRHAAEFLPDEPRHYFAQLNAYQAMPDERLLLIQPVVLRQPVEEWLSRAGRRAKCDACGEEILNEREVRRGGQILCRACGGASYYDCSCK